MRKIFIAILSVAIVTLALWVVPNISFDTTAFMEALTRTGKNLL